MQKKKLPSVLGTSAEALIRSWPVWRLLLKDTAVCLQILMRPSIPTDSENKLQLNKSGQDEKMPGFWDIYQNMVPVVFSSSALFLDKNILCQPAEQICGP